MGNNSRTVVKVATWSVAVITLLVGLVGAIGYVLPQNHVAARDALVSAQPAVLFDLIVDVSKYPQWRPDVTRVDILARAPLKCASMSGVTSSRSKWWRAGLPSVCVYGSRTRTCRSAAPGPTISLPKDPAPVFGSPNMARSTTRSFVSYPDS